MTTTTDAPNQQHRTRRGPLVAVITLLAVVLLGAGVATGWLIAQPEEQPQASAYSAGGGDLTASQTQMLDTYNELMAAWQAGDVQGVEALFTENGVLSFMKDDYRVDDGGLAGWVKLLDWKTEMTVLSPVVIDAKTLVGMHRTSGYEISDVFEFEVTDSGEALVARWTAVPEIGHPYFALPNAH